MHCLYFVKCPLRFEQNLERYYYDSSRSDSSLANWSKNNFFSFYGAFKILKSFQAPDPKFTIEILSYVENILLASLVSSRWRNKPVLFFRFRFITISLYSIYDLAKNYYRLSLITAFAERVRFMNHSHMFGASACIRNEHYRGHPLL